MSSKAVYVVIKLVFASVVTWLFWDRLVGGVNAINQIYTHNSLLVSVLTILAVAVFAEVLYRGCFYVSGKLLKFLGWQKNK